MSPLGALWFKVQWFKDSGDRTCMPDQGTHGLCTNLVVPSLENNPYFVGL